MQVVSVLLIGALLHTSCNVNPSGEVTVTVVQILPVEQSAVESQAYQVELTRMDTYASNLTVGVGNWEGDLPTGILMPETEAQPSDYLTNDPNRPIQTITSPDGEILFQYEINHPDEPFVMNTAADFLATNTQADAYMDRGLSDALAQALRDLGNQGVFDSLKDNPVPESGQLQTRMAAPPTPGPSEEILSNIVSSVTEAVAEVTTTLSLTNGGEAQAELQEGIERAINTAHRPQDVKQNGASLLKAQPAPATAYSQGSPQALTQTEINNQVVSILKSGDMIWNDTSTSVGELALSGHIGMFNKARNQSTSQQEAIFTILSGDKSRYYSLDSHTGYIFGKAISVNHNTGVNGQSAVENAFTKYKDKSYWIHYLKSQTWGGVYCSQLSWLAWMDQDGTNLDGNPFPSHLFQKKYRVAKNTVWARIGWWFLRIFLIIIIVFVFVVTLDIVYPQDIVNSNKTTEEFFWENTGGI